MIPELNRIDLTIIIVNWNGGEMLRRCLCSIETTRENLQAQVIVMDNASGDGSRQMAEKEFPEMTIINTGANLGFGKANNLARSLVKSDLVLFLNPDTVVLEGTLQKIIAFINGHADIGALGCRMIGEDGAVHELGLQYFPSPWTEFLSLLFLTTATRKRLKAWLPRLDPNRNAYAIKLYGGCLLCRKSALDQAGWFDERYFMYAEDADLCHAIQQHGWTLYYFSEATIIHTAGGTSAKAPGGFSILMQCESVAKMISKHYGTSGGLLYRAGTCVGALLRLTIVLVVSFVMRLSQMRRDIDFRSCVLKQKLLLLWSLGLRKPVVGS